jgi:hypothetical protein
VPAACWLLCHCWKPANRYPKEAGLSENKLRLLEEIADTILPKTAGSPGAKEAMIRPFLKSYVEDCFSPAEQKAVIEGLQVLNNSAKDKYHIDFLQLEPSKRHELLVGIDKEALQQQNKPGGPVHYFSMIKNMVIFGYFTSKAGATQCLRYLPVPHRYEGNINYQKGDKAWATS